MYNIINKLEKSKKKAKNGVEYWRARDLQEILGYSEWRNFSKVIEKAKRSSRENGRDNTNHFVESNKMVCIGEGSKSKRPVKDYILSRYASYLIAMNGDSKKPEVASAQEYFAVQTRISETNTNILNAKKRVDERERLTENTKKLNNVAQMVGVKRFGKFQNAGYESMYGGLNNQEIKNYKNIPSGDKLFDRIGRAELAAHNFRATQAEIRLSTGDVSGENDAIKIHSETGKYVRDTMRKAGGEYPEDLKIEPHIKETKKMLKKFQTYKKINPINSQS